MENERIRSAAKRNRVCLWEIGQRFGVNDGTFSRWMRVAFSPDKERKALDYIDEIARTRRGFEA